MNILSYHETMSMCSKIPRFKRIFGLLEGSSWFHFCLTKIVVLIYVIHSLLVTSNVEICLDRRA